MPLLLDTHAFVWLASDQTQLTERGLEAIRAQAGVTMLSSISALEIGLLVKRGRLVLPLAPEDFIARALAQHGIEEVPLDRDVALRSASLPDLHNDPFDRIIIATAHRADATILTRDAVIPTYPGVRVVW